MPSSAAFRHRFGNLVAAYTLIGYSPQVDYGFIEVNRRLRRQHPTIVADVISQIEAIGGRVIHNEETDLLLVNREFRTSIAFLASGDNARLALVDSTG